MTALQLFRKNLGERTNRHGRTVVERGCDRPRRRRRRRFLVMSLSEDFCAVLKTDRIEATRRDAGELAGRRGRRSPRRVRLSENTGEPQTGGFGAGTEPREGVGQHLEKQQQHANTTPPPTPTLSVLVRPRSGKTKKNAKRFPGEGARGRRGRNAAVRLVGGTAADPGLLPWQQT